MLSFPASDFDEWAGSYDSSVGRERGFPFEGYAGMLQKIVSIADPHAGDSVLDLGTGTGNLAKLFADRGCEVCGTDFSPAMLEIAGTKVTDASFFLHDVRKQIPPDLDRMFDFIVSAYVFHHFNHAEKLKIIQRLYPHLNKGGQIIIGDIMFTNRAELEKAKQECGDDWEDELYWLIEGTAEKLNQIDIPFEFCQLSRYLGVIRIKKS